MTLKLIIIIKPYKNNIVFNVGLINFNNNVNINIIIIITIQNYFFQLNNIDILN